MMMNFNVKDFYQKRIPSLSFEKYRHALFSALYLRVINYGVSFIELTRVLSLGLFDSDFGRGYHSTQFKS